MVYGVFIPAVVVLSSEKCASNSEIGGPPQLHLPDEVIHAHGKGKGSCCGPKGITFR